MLSKESAGISLLINLFKDQKEEMLHPFLIGRDVYSARYLITPIVKNEEYEYGEYSEGCNIQFFIPEEYYELLCEYTGTTLRHFILAYFDEGRETTDLRH